MHILVLQGGTSNEREVSLKSSRNVIEALKANGHDVTAYDTRDGLEKIPPLLAKVDVVFPVLHGTEGEDGAVQKVLEASHIPFVGTGSRASALCFDKIATKKTLEANGIPTPKWEEVDAESFAASPLSKNPYVLKPHLGGSSIDTCVVRDPNTTQPDLTLFSRYETLLLEELIEGTELTISILGDSALPVIEIIPPEDGEFDYENKYNGASQELCPPQNVSIELQEQAQRLAEQTHRVCGAEHFSRVDIMMSETHEFFVLEINTIPGLTSESLYPKAAGTAGIPMKELVEKLVDMAVHR